MFVFDTICFYECLTLLHIHSDLPPQHFSLAKVRPRTLWTFRNLAGEVVLKRDVFQMIETAQLNAHKPWMFVEDVGSSKM